MLHEKLMLHEKIVIKIIGRKILMYLTTNHI